MGRTIGETMSAWKRVAALMGIYLCSLMVVAVPAAAQVSGAAVSMTCAPGQIQVEVKPGATLTGYTTCTVSNPTAYVEKVAIQVTSDGLATAAPGDMYVGASQEVDFQVVVRANPYMQMQSRQLTVSASVQEINNLPPPNTASSQVNALINIMQFSIVQVEAVEPFVQLMPKTDKNFQFKVYNFGNQIDRMKIGVTENTRETLEEAGFTVNLPQTVVTIEPNTAPETARIMVRTPKNQGWSDAYHVLEFYAESEFACQNGGCNRESQMITVYVRGVYLPGFEIVPAISMIALAGAVAGRRFLNTEDEGEEEAS
ncbi:MAG TPA: hypothetical protein HA353_00405, partial [Candidatus Poseidonia sp.]|nr:hypothetical protein [Poseidonia sp.]